MLPPRERRQIKVATLVSIVLFSIGAVVAGLVGYWSLTGDDVLIFHKDPIPETPKFVKSEDKIILDIDFCKLSDTPGRVTQRLVSNKTELFAPTVTETQPAGCYHYKLPIPIPPQTSPDKYHINYRVVYQTNPFHTVVEEVNSEEFEVIE